MSDFSPTGHTALLAMGFTNPARYESGGAGSVPGDLIDLRSIPTNNQAKGTNPAAPPQRLSTPCVGRCRMTPAKLPYLRAIISR